MPVKIENRVYYRTAEVCQTAGISKTTLFRWLKEGYLGKSKRRDIRGWRLFTKQEINALLSRINQINEGG